MASEKNYRILDEDSVSPNGFPTPEHERKANLMMIWWALIWRNMTLIFIVGFIVAMFQDHLDQPNELQRLKRLLMDSICATIYIGTLIAHLRSPLKLFFGQRLGWSDEAWIKSSRYFAIYFALLATINMATWFLFSSRVYNLLVVIHMPVNLLFPAIVANWIRPLINQAKRPTVPAP
jgi:intracellular septation protein A